MLLSKFFLLQNCRHLSFSVSISVSGFSLAESFIFFYFLMGRIIHFQVKNFSFHRLAHFRFETADFVGMP